MKDDEIKNKIKNKNTSIASVFLEDSGISNVNNKTNTANTRKNNTIPSFVTENNPDIEKSLGKNSDSHFEFDRIETVEISDSEEETINENEVEETVDENEDNNDSENIEETFESKSDMTEEELKDSPSDEDISEEEEEVEDESEYGEDEEEYSDEEEVEDESEHGEEEENYSDEDEEYVDDVEEGEYGEDEEYPDNETDDYAKNELEEHTAGYIEQTLDDLEEYEKQEEQEDINLINQKMYKENENDFYDNFDGVLTTTNGSSLIAYFNNNEKNTIEGTVDGLILKALCPICGSEIFNKDDNVYYSKDVFNPKDLYCKEIKLDKNNSVEYLCCPNCCENIKNDYKKSGIIHNRNISVLIKYIAGVFNLEYSFDESYKLMKELPLYITDVVYLFDNDTKRKYFFSLLDLINILKEYFESNNIEDVDKQVLENILELEDNESINKIRKFFNSNENKFKIEVINKCGPLSGIVKNNVDSDIKCGYNCKGCPNDFTFDNIQEFYEYNFLHITGDKETCKLYKLVEDDEKLTIDKLPELTKKEIDTLVKNKPTEKDLEKYKNKFSKEFDDEELIDELSIREYIKDKIKEENLSKQNKKLSEENETTFTMDEEGDSEEYIKKEKFDKENDSVENWFDDNVEIERKKREKEKEDRINYKKVSSEEILSGIEKTNDDIDPALEDMTLEETFINSPFYKVVEYVRMNKANSAKLKVQLGSKTSYIPVIDFSTGVRIICIDTDDYEIPLYKLNPIDISNEIPFYYREHLNDYNTYTLYKCDAKYKALQIAMAIVKLVNFKTSYPKRRICHIMDNYIPLYNTEREICNLFFQKHSTLAFDRFHVDSLIVLGLLNDDKYKDSYVENKREIYKSRIEKFSKQKNEGVLMSALAGIKYYSSIIRDSYGTGAIIGKKYVITQYTENIHLMLDNGFWYCILALMKEHEMVYNANRDISQPRVFMEISFEVDRATIPSPILLEMIRNDGCLDPSNRSYSGEELEVSNSYKGLTVNSTKHAGLIPNPNDRVFGRIKDEAVIDVRYFGDKRAMQLFFDNVNLDNEELNTPLDKKNFLIKKGYDVEFTIPESIRIDIKSNGLKNLLTSDAFRTLRKEQLKDRNWTKEKIEDIISECNASSISNIMGPIWDSFKDNIDNKFIKNAIENIGKNIKPSDLKTLGEIIFGKK